MRFKTAVNLLVAQWADARDSSEAIDTPAMFLGKPGIGKTSIGYEVTAEMTKLVTSKSPLAPKALCDVLDLSSTLPEDLGGIPFKEFDEADQIAYTVFAIRKRLAPFCKEGAYGVLVLDDITQAANSVQVATRQLVLKRQLGDFTLSPGVLLMVTGNRREDKSGASTLPAHFRNATCILSVEPDVEEWAEWYGRQPKSEPVVAAFLRYRPSHLAQTPAESDRAGAFATPRSWAKLGRLMGVAKEVGVDLEVARGLVGEGVAIEFRGFINTRAQLVDPADVLRNPKGAMPDVGILNTPDKAYALITGLGEVAAQWRKEAEGDRAEITKVAVMLMRSIAWASQDQQEYLSVAVSTYTSNGGHITDLVNAARSQRADPLVATTLNFLVKAVKGGQTT